MAADLLCAVAHPDDESFGLGSILAQASADGHRVVVVCATRGELGPMALYHSCLPRSLMDRWAIERGEDAGVYGDERMGRADEEITTVLEGHDVLDARCRAIALHRTQASPFDGLSPELQRAFLTTDHLVRIEPAWTGGPQESALFGL